MKECFFSVIVILVKDAKNDSYEKKEPLNSDGFFLLNLLSILSDCGRKNIEMREATS